MPKCSMDPLNILCIFNSFHCYYYLFFLLLFLFLYIFLIFFLTKISQCLSFQRKCKRFSLKRYILSLQKTEGLVIVETYYGD